MKIARSGRLGSLGDTSKLFFLISVIMTLGPGPPPPSSLSRVMANELIVADMHVNRS